MPAERFGEFTALSGASHAADNVASGRWLEQEAVGLAQQELARLLPQGVATPSHSFYEVKAHTSEQVVGFVWLGTASRGSAEVAFLYQLIVLPEYRRKGFARAALAKVEELAKSMGLAAVALNVFGSNAGAQALYRSVGYQVTSIGMQKLLPA